MAERFDKSITGTRNPGGEGKGMGCTEGKVTKEVNIKQKRV